MSNQYKNNLGEDIINIVQNALNNENFKSLNQDIGNIVKGALGEVKGSFNWEENRKKTNQQYISINKNQGKTSLAKRTKYAVPVGKTKGILYTIFGTIGTITFGIAVFVLMLLGYIIGGKGIFHIIAMGLTPLILISVILLVNGSKIRKRLNRFERYIKRMYNRDYYLIRELSAVTGQSDKATVRDLEKMISVGMFPEGRMDDKGNYFMLNNKSYEEYLKFKEGLIIKQNEERDNRKVTDNLTKGDSKLRLEEKKIIDGGRQFVLEIKDANIAIPGEAISKKLDRLEIVTGKVFDYVEIHPEKLPEIKKFMGYFLPTTLKLLHAYKKLDSQPIEGRNISSSKEEIEDTIDTINLAFENLLDGLFEDLAMNVSADISVLETIFMQEGLMNDGIRTQNRTREE